MKRILISIFTLVLVATVAFAVPAKRGQWRMLTLADGTKVKAELRGDEHLSFYVSEDGRAFVATQQGIYKQADIAQLRANAEARRMDANSHRTTNDAQRRKAYTGQKKGLVILAQFKDVKFNTEHTQALYNQIMNTANYSSSKGFVGSVHDYFTDMSNGQFNLTFDVVGPVTLSNNMAYYGEHYSTAYGEMSDHRAPQMIKEACELAKSLTSSSEYDWDGDGYVDQVVVIYAGLGEANGGSDDSIWPHEYQLLAQYAAYSLPVIGGKRVNKYACSSELQPASWGYDSNGQIVPTSTRIDGIGTFCHEFSHCLGLPDFYDTEHDSSNMNFGMNCWDLMDQGSYNGDGYSPAGYTSYERMFAGWQTPINLNADREVTGMKALTEGGESYIIYNKANNNEYFLLENRQKTKWDAELPGNGLLILHVDYDASVWWENKVNNDADHQRCTIMHADNSESGLEGDPYPYRTNNTFSNISRPAATFYNNNSDGTKNMNCVVKDITRNSDNTISFNFYASATAPDDDAPEVIDHTDAVFYESFDQCNGSGGNDGLWEGSGVATSTLKTDMTGWLYNEAKGANKCGMFGAKKAGVCVTPKFTLNGSTTLAFYAAPWGSDDTSLKVEVVGSGSVANSDFTMRVGKWTVCKTTITGTGEMQLRFTPGNRFFLDEVVVQKASEVDAILSVDADADSKTVSRIYTIDGRYVGTDLNSLPAGFYVVGGRKVLVK